MCVPRILSKILSLEKFLDDCKIKFSVYVVIEHYMCNVRQINVQVKQRYAKEIDKKALILLCFLEYKKFPSNTNLNEKRNFFRFF